MHGSVFVCVRVGLWGWERGSRKKCRRSFFNIFDPAVFNGIELVAGINKGFDICPHKSLISSQYSFSRWKSSQFFSFQHIHGY